MPVTTEGVVRLHPVEGADVAVWLRRPSIDDRGFVPVRLLLIRDLTSLGFPLTGERGDDLP